MKTYTLKEVLALYEDNNESGYYYGYKGIVLNAIEKGKRKTVVFYFF